MIFCQAFFKQTRERGGKSPCCGSAATAKQIQAAPEIGGPLWRPYTEYPVCNLGNEYHSAAGKRRFLFICRRPAKSGETDILKQKTRR